MKSAVAAGPAVEIGGVLLRDLTLHDDDRGSVTEIFRQSWFADFEPVQWNYVRSQAGVLRGVHGHFRHADYLILLEGSAIIGLKDLRPGSATAHRSAIVNMDGARLQSLTIPPGVAHGFYFAQASALIYSVTHYWDSADELGCRWDDAGLNIPWPCEAPAISPRDAALPGLSIFERQLAEALLVK